MPVFKKVNKSFFKKWSPEMAYVLGFFAADGYITVNKRGGQFWCIQITDKKILEQIREAIQSEHKISVRVRSGNESTLYRLQIGSIEMCENLRRLGFSERKTKSLVVPNVPEKYFSDFVRGYFDGDGNVWTGIIHKQRKTRNFAIQASFTSCSKVFLESILERLAMYNFDGGSVYKIKENCYRLQFGTCDTLKLYNFMYNHGSHLEDSLFLERKREVFERYGKLRNLRW
ncbi:MAG: hypothetical protein COW60_03090 [Candidatus Yonathbacteria bacterium CG17_big_fil_post_rev_8_21_14_2_50_43_9]|nr:MAG: hypothetical protein COW60_03090 [Candidatus Yonathbacteria bacterium CG17_big_fil_post_rev_8_21_14_2_50_43_9]PIX56956.1 MAG: hypothetical protein COZ48_03420 [Candidatus Yonathbacteria bacterium CG_4_10_14_3_um_filter_43_12]